MPACAGMTEEGAGCHSRERGNPGLRTGRCFGVASSRLGTELIMHEWGYCEGILEAVQRRAAGRRVKRARVRVGVLHRLNQNALQQAFALAASGSEAQDAILDLAFVPARWRCHLCQEESEGADI